MKYFLYYCDVSMKFMQFICNPNYLKLVRKIMVRTVALRCVFGFW